MKKGFSISVFFVFLFFVTVAQNVIVRGKVVDAKTGFPLAFVNISGCVSGKGTVSDVKGNFSLKTKVYDSCFLFSYVGYERKTYKISNNKRYIIVALKPQPLILDEVTVKPGINPANRIIKLAVEHKKVNDPDNLESYRYIVYDKLTVSPDVKRILKDTVFNDSAQMELARFIKKQDFFLMETVRERSFKRPGLQQERILATRVSGLKDPLILFMITGIQSESIYDDKITIAGNDYVNPVSRGSTSKYFFRIEDTVVKSPADTTYIISFMPGFKKNFDGLKGLLYINNNDWAVRYFEATPAKEHPGMNISISRAYKKTGPVWFPFQLKTVIVFKNMRVTVGDKAYPLIATGVSKIKDIEVNPGLKRKNFGLYETEVSNGAANRKDEFWERYRGKITDRDKETYRVIDSVGKAQGLDKKVAFFKTMMTGKLPVGFVNIDMDKLFGYNVYEGFYIGLGAHTNQKFSGVFSIGGFAGYGFHDKDWKYGVDVSALIHKPTESRVYVEYYKQPVESGEVRYFSDRMKQWSPENFGDFFIERENLTKGLEFNYSFRLKPIRDFKWNLGFVLQEKYAFRNYDYVPFDSETVPGRYNFSKMVFGFRFAFREKNIKTGDEVVPVKSGFPVLNFKLTTNVKNLAGSNFSFNKLDLRFTDRLETKYYGDFIWSLNFGYLFGDAPAPELYFLRGTYRIFTLYAPNTFGTMLPNEFLSDRYFSAFLTWDFKDLLVGWGNWSPQLMLVTNFGIGYLKNPEYHKNIDFRTMEKGYYESGFIIRKLIDFKIMDLGAGILYRYGPYSFDKQSDNFAYKLSVYYGL